MISFTDLTVRYDGTVALRGVSGEAADGEWLGVIGPNGAGKTTLLNALARLLRFDGQVTLCGRPSARLSRRDLARLVAYVPQRPVLPPDMTVSDYVLLGRNAHIGYLRVETAADKNICAGVLERLDLTSMAHRTLRAMSGGELQRLVLARALAQVKGETCVSLYLRTSRLGADAKFNRAAFKDLAKEALSQLREAGVDKRRINIFEEQFDRFAGAEHNVQDEDKIRKLQRAKPDPIDQFWHYQANGLAVLAAPGMIRTFRLPDPPKPLAEVADRFHLTPLIRVMSSPHDVLVLALAEERVRLVHAFVNFPPQRLHVPDLPGSAEEATRRPSFHVRAPRRRLQNIEGEKVLLHEYVRKVEQAIHGVLAGSNRPLVLAAAEPLVSMFRSVNSYPRLANEMIEGNPDLMTDAELEDAAIPVDLFAQELKTVIALYDELKPERATTDVFLCRARGNRRRRRSTSRRLRRGCSRPRQRHRRQRHLFGFR